MVFENWFSLVEEKLTRWATYLIKMLPNMVLAVVIMVLFIIAARLFRRVVSKFVMRLSKSESITGLVSGLLYSMVIIFGMMTALNILKLDQAVTSLLAGVGIIGLALGFAFQDLTSNFISGAFIAFKRPFDVGHIIETNGFVGTVEDIQLRSTRLKTMTGLYVIIPNKDIFQKPIINHTLSGSHKIEIEFAIPNTYDLARIEALLIAAIGKTTGATDVQIFFTSIDDPKIKTYISFWASGAVPEDFARIKHEAIRHTFDALAAEGVYVLKDPAKPR